MTKLRTRRAEGERTTDRARAARRCHQPEPRAAAAGGRGRLRHTPPAAHVLARVGMRLLLGSGPDVAETGLHWRGAGLRTPLGYAIYFV